MNQRDKWMVTLTVMTGTFMAAIDGSIVNVALPHMRGNFGATVEEITWVVTGYILANVIIMPLIAFLSSRFGRKRMYQFCVFLFVLSSMFCGMARNLSAMVFFRIIQGIGGGALIPIAQSILRETFPPEEQGMAMGIFGMGIMLGPALGPTFGGWLTDNFSWPWIFYINVPVGILNMTMVHRNISDPPYLKRESGKVDFLGLGLMVLGLSMLQLMLEKGESLNWFQSRSIINLALLSGVGLALFIWRELVVAKPMVDLKILRNRNFAVGTALSSVIGMALFGSLFLLPLFLQELLGYTAFYSGIALIPRSIAMLITMPFAGRLYNRLGPRVLIGLGMTIAFLSFLQFSRLSLTIGMKDIFFSQFFQGVGMGMVFVAMSTVALSSVAKPKMQAATGLYNVVRQIFGSIGIAIFATQLDRAGVAGHARLVERLTPFRNTSVAYTQRLQGALLSSGLDPATAHAKSLKILNLIVTRQAMMISFNHAFLLAACLFLFSLPLIFLLKPKHGLLPAVEVENV